jgi:hypothetical protein
VISLVLDADNEANLRRPGHPAPRAANVRKEKRLGARRCRLEDGSDRGKESFLCEQLTTKRRRQIEAKTRISFRQP